MGPRWFIITLPNQGLANRNKRMMRFRHCMALLRNLRFIQMLCIDMQKTSQIYPVVICYIASELLQPQPIYLTIIMVLVFGRPEIAGRTALASGLNFKKMVIFRFARFVSYIMQVRESLFHQLITVVMLITGVIIVI